MPINWKRTTPGDVLIELEALAATRADREDFDDEGNALRAEWQGLAARARALGASWHATTLRANARSYEKIYGRRPTTNDS